MHAVILGIIQGLTEFLPISSSGHLLIIPYLLGWPPSGLTFDVALNTGTFIAAVIYFFPTWWELFVKGILQRQAKELRLLGYLVLATIPAAIAGYKGEKLISDTLRQPVLASIMLIVFGLILWWAARTAKEKKSIAQLTWPESLGIGVAQAFALIPGVSRSGITITSGLFLGLTREEATRFSFLLLAPISLGAAVTQFSKALHAHDTTNLVIGTVVSFLVGLGAIHFMLKFLKKYGFTPYVWYRVVAGLVFLALLLK